MIEGENATFKDGFAAECTLCDVKATASFIEADEVAIRHSELAQDVEATATEVRFSTVSVDVIAGWPVLTGSICGCEVTATNSDLGIS
jgi:hypothetical protein